ncbi:hypothetical protein VN97_g4420 [Penicillium thymicola]|uniref:DUF7924 domain-containing protein n=1 Tax=Penicillium thymicola TaxID=293382 RepID=A0AAI9TLG1_PENTH|nr:hypothetical protein VN97_g4420 [Penicillium thymicola]
MLKRNLPGLQSLDELTTETFENCRIVPGNEPTIQTVIVPGLINLHGIIRDKTTHAAVGAQFVAECVLPLRPEADDDSTKITSPYPDLVVGLRRTLFQDYCIVLRQLDTITAPIICTPAIVFPCFTVEVKGESGASDARNQNYNNAAHMLRHLRLLSCQARGEQYTQESFDGVVRVLSATVTQYMVTISGHWTVLKSGHVYTYSYLLKSASIEHITNKQWNEVSRYLQNGTIYIIQKTRQQVEDNLKCIQGSGLLSATQPYRPPKAAKIGKQIESKWKFRSSCSFVPFLFSRSLLAQSEILRFYNLSTYTDLWGVFQDREVIFEWQRQREEKTNEANSIA